MKATRKLPLVPILFSLFATVSLAQTQSQRPWQEITVPSTGEVAANFKAPPREYGAIAAFTSWNGAGLSNVKKEDRRRSRLPVTAGEAFRHAWSRIGRYTWLMLLRSLIIALPILAILAVIVVGGLLVGLVTRGSLSSNASSGALFLLIPLGILLYLGGAVYAVIMTLRLSLAFPACVHENLTAGQAIKRSGLLTQGAKGRIFLVLLIIYAISYAAIMVLYVVGLFVFAIGALAGAGNFQHPTPLTIGVLVVAGIAILALFLLWTALLMAGYSITYAVFYRDQRLRKDGPPFAPVTAAS